MHVRRTAQPEFPKTVAIHLGSYGARTVAQVAIQIAYDSGKLGRLNRAIDQMREDAGIGEGEDFDCEYPIVERRVEYDALVEQCGELLTRIDDTMIVETLRRYRLGHIAELFERSRSEFEELATQGRKILFPDDEKRSG